MRKLTVVLILLLLFGCATIATNKTTVTEPKKSEWVVSGESNYTYDGNYDPAMFATWEEIKRYRCPKGHTHVLFSNPVSPNAIQYVEMVFIETNTRRLLIGYAYSCDGVQYMFVLNLKNNHYTQIKPIPRHKRNDAL